MFTLPSEVEASRNKLLRAVGSTADITFIRGYGNIGDHLIYAGCRRLLAEFNYKEASIMHLEGVAGHTAVVSGGGAWCRPYHDMPPFLPVIESKFERVVVLPSSFDVSEETVREALSATRALVFAREPESYRQIRALCNADIAHDCAFFFDYSPYLKSGEGALLAYRGDRESADGQRPREDNDDISTSCESLDQWLWTIARYQTIRTDRAHVMIAAAMMGKKVVYKSSSYHKVPAIAEYALKDYNVFPEGDEEAALSTARRKVNHLDLRATDRHAAAVEEEPIAPELKSALINKALNNFKSIPVQFLDGRTEPEVTVVILSHNRIGCTSRAVQSVIENTRVPIKILVIDNGSGDEVRGELTRLKARHDCVRLTLLNRNLGCAGGRMQALALVDTPYIAFIDNDVEVLPYAIEHLLYRLETTAEAMAVAGMIVRPDGTVQLCGGDYKIENGVFWHIFLGEGRSFDDPVIGASGPCTWVNGTMFIIRKEFLDRNRYDPLMRHYYEDVEWCFRLNQLGKAVFYRSVEALAIHYHEPKVPSAYVEESERRARAIKYIESIGRFYQVHGKVIEALFTFMPELGSPNQPLDVKSAKKVLELVNARGADWVLDQWSQGELAPFFAGSQFQAAAERKYSELPDDSVVPRLREAIAGLSGRVAQDLECMSQMEENAEQVRQSFAGQIEAKEAQITSRDAELAQIRGSFGWRLLSQYGKIKYRYLLPLYKKSSD